MINQKKIDQKGGNILGQGRDGCTIDNPIMSDKTKNPNDYVSKLINVTNVSDEEYLKEFEVGKLFKKYDPNNYHFLPGLDLTVINEPKKLSSEQLQDIKQCGYPTNNMRLLNIIIKKGMDFTDITEDLETEDYIKVILYLLYSCMASVYELETVLLDIKPDNLLYSKKTSKSKEIYPVIIDFSKDFVLKGKEELEKFYQGFGLYASYQYPFEINSLYYKYLLDNKDDSKMMKFIKNIKENFNIDLNMEEEKDKLINYEYKLQNLMDTKEGLLYIFDKFMVYKIGFAFLNIENKNIDITIINLLKKMTLFNFNQRPLLIDIINEFELLLNNKVETFKDLSINNNFNKVILSQSKTNNDNLNIIPEKLIDIKNLYEENKYNKPYINAIQDFIGSIFDSSESITLNYNNINSLSISTLKSTIKQTNNSYSNKTKTLSFKNSSSNFNNLEYNLKTLKTNLQSEYKDYISNSNISNTKKSILNKSFMNSLKSLKTNKDISNFKTNLKSFISDTSTDYDNIIKENRDELYKNLNIYIKNKYPKIKKNDKTKLENKIKNIIEEKYKDKIVKIESLIKDYNNYIFV